MTHSDESRRSFLKTTAALAGTAPLLAQTLAAQADEPQGPLMAYVGTFSSPLRDVLPTQVDLPPGNGRGIHLFRVDRQTGALTADGVLGEVSVGERNLLGRGQSVRAAIQYGQRSRGFDLSFVEPYLMGNRVAFGIDVFGKQTNNLNYLSYNTRTIGGGLRLGVPLTDNLNLTTRYSGYSQKITLPDTLNDCIYSPT